MLGQVEQDIDQWKRIGGRKTVMCEKQEMERKGIKIGPSGGGYFGFSVSPRARFCI